MQDAPSRQLFEGWGPFASLPLHQQEQLRTELLSINLQPGEMLYDFEQLPPGVLSITEGQLRLLGLDQRKEPFTLERYSRGQLAGAEQLLRGIPGQAMAASTALQATLLPAELFLQLIQQHPSLLNGFRELRPAELYAVTASRNDPRLPAAQELLQWARQACGQAHVVELLPPGEQQLSDVAGSWLISSGNIEGETPGTLLQGAEKLNVLGRLPARLLPVPAHWPPQRQQEPSSLEAPAPSEPAPSLQLQREALEDWYGRLRDDGSFPQYKRSPA